MGKLEGKVALITGGNSGIGLATAKRFVDEGAYVFITGRREAELNAAVKEIGANVTGVQGDVANLGDLDRLFAQIKRKKGKLDIIFANAGITPQTPLGNITEEAYDSLFNVNVKGLLFTIQNALPLMPDGGSIILNASIVASKGFAHWSVYSATKAAVRSFARTWTVDLKDRHIRVNALSPGYIDTAPWRSDSVAEIRANIMSSGTIVFTKESTQDQSELNIYQSKVRKTFEGHPIKVLAAYGPQQVLEGPAPEGVVIAEFPTTTAAREWYDGPAYQAIVQHRFKGASYRAVLVEGV